MSHSIVFIDSRVADQASFIAAFPSGTSWVTLNPQEDGLQQMQAALAGVSGLDAIHLLTHGSVSTLYFGSTVLDADSLDTYASSLQAIGKSLHTDGDILLYGCNVAQGVVGADFVERLAQITGANVAASTNATGATVLHGDWLLEQVSGNIKTATIINNNYSELLQTIAGTNNNDYLSGTSSADIILGLPGDDSLNGGFGNDTLDGGDNIDETIYYNSPSAVVVNLASGTTSGGSGNDVLISIENAVGSDFDDILIGDDKNNGLFGNYGNDKLFGGNGDDILQGYVGDDTLDGGNGIDTTGYWNSLYGMNVNLNTGTASGGTEKDILINIENIGGSNFDDTLIGNANNNSLSGDNGNDILHGENGNDSLYGGDGNDYLYGSDGGDQLRGDNGNDSIDGGTGDDYITGGNGDDTLDGGAGGKDCSDYYNTDSTGPVVVNLELGIASSNDGNDALINIENINGTNFNDTITGDINSNFFEGRAGDDRLDGKGGDDYLKGGKGSDTLTGGDGSDVFIFEKDDYSEVDYITDFSNTDSIEISGVAISPNSMQLFHMNNNTTILKVDTNNTPGFDLQINLSGEISSNNLSISGSRITFSSVIDTLAPTVTNFSPVDGVSNVAIDSNITLNFSETIQRGSGTISLQTTYGTIVELFDAATSNNITITDSTLTINPTSNLKNDTNYKLLIPGGVVKDLAGNNYAGTFSYGFGTISNNNVSEPSKIPGIVITDFGGPQDIARNILIQPDGKIVAAGISGDDFGLIRYNTNGSLDANFGNAGKVTTDFEGHPDLGISMMMQSDEKILVAGGAVDNSSSNFGLVRYQTNGSLDTSFGNNGKVMTDFGSYDEGRSVKIQNDGKIVVAGTSYINETSSNDSAIVRYDTNGNLDNSFDGDGKVTTDFGNKGKESVFDMTTQSDGKILVIGTTGDLYAISSGNDIYLVRYNANGSLDTSFDGDGKVTTDIGGNADFGRCVAIQTDGKIIVAGTTYNLYPMSNDFALVRYNTNGTLDTTFDGDGRVTTNFGKNDEIRGLVIQPDGKILVVGYATNDTTGYDFALARYNPNGSLDTSFDGDGKVTTDLGNKDLDYGYDIVIERTGKIVVAGYTNNPITAGYDFALARYNSNGSLDVSFNGQDTPIKTDTTLPTVISFNPSDAAIGVNVGSDITMNFSESIQRGSGNIVLKTATGLIIETYDAAISSNLNFSGSTLTINPSSNLTYSTQYFVELATDSVKDLVGNGYIGTSSYDFTTAGNQNSGKVIYGTSVADKLSGTTGNDTFNAGAGIDIVVLQGRRADYTVIKINDHWTISSSGEGLDTLNDVERLNFTDQTFALDVDGNSGQVYRLYQAAFGRTPDQIGLGYWISNLDKGKNLIDISTGFISSNEFKGLYGDRPSNEILVNKFYQNVLHRQPEQSGFDWWVGELNSGHKNASQVLTGFSESAENKANLLGVIGNGFEYTPYGI